MVVLYAADGALERRLTEIDWGDLPTDVCRTWWDFRRRIADASCFVWADPWLERTGTLARLRHLRGRFPLQPLVVVTAREADNARLLHALVLQDIVWLDEVDAHLRSAVAHAREEGVLWRLSRWVLEAKHIHTRLRQAMATACSQDATLRSVADLATSAARDRRTIWRWWQESFGREPALGPKDFLDWLVLLRAVTLKSSGRSWEAVARSLNIHVDTLARIARRLLDARLSDVDAGGQAALAPRFLEAVLPVLRPPEPCDEQWGDELRRIERICGGMETAFVV